MTPEEARENIAGNSPVNNLIEAKDALQLVFNKLQNDNPETIASANKNIKDAAQIGHTSTSIQVETDFARSLDRYLTNKGYSVSFPPMALGQEIVTLIVKW